MRRGKEGWEQCKKRRKTRVTDIPVAIRDTLRNLLAEMQQLAESHARFEKALFQHLVQPRGDRPRPPVDVENVVRRSHAVGRTWTAPVKLAGDGDGDDDALSTGRGAPTSGVPFLLPENWLSCLVRRVGLEESRNCEDSVFTLNASVSWKHRRANCSKAVDPDSTPSLVHNVISVAVLVVEFTVLPFAWAWQLESLVFSWFSPFFWTVDLLPNLVTGLLHPGRRRARTVVHYLRRSFVVGGARRLLFQRVSHRCAHFNHYLILGMASPLDGLSLLYDI